MKVKFEEFLKLYEKDEFIISLLDVENVIKNVFNDKKVSSVKTLYEKDEETNKLKLVITINNLYFNETDILHTKIVFYVDDKKTKILKNVFYYLYDIICEFKEVSFNDITDFENKLNDIIDNRKFGKDLKELSDIVITIAVDVNKWLSKNNIENVSVFNISYTPILDNIPCESLSFKFDININDNRNIELRFRKVNDNEYKFTFKENDWFYDVVISDVKGMVQVIGETIKNHIL